jgi:hypothetical protein
MSCFRSTCVLLIALSAGALNRDQRHLWHGNGCQRLGHSQRPCHRDRDGNRRHDASRHQ